jgi:hypothetical protein
MSHWLRNVYINPLLHRFLCLSSSHTFPPLSPKDDVKRRMSLCLPSGSTKISPLPSHGCVSTSSLLQKSRLPVTCAGSLSFSENCNENKGCLGALCPLKTAITQRHVPRRVGFIQNWTIRRHVRRRSWEERQGRRGGITEALLADCVTPDNVLRLRLLPKSFTTSAYAFAPPIFQS